MIARKQHTRAVVLASVVALASFPATSAAFTVDHAFLPGVGRVGTTLPTDTEVRAPGFIPQRVVTSAKEDNRAERRQRRLADEIVPRPDAGPKAAVKAIKHDFARDLFLNGAATSCIPYPKAGRWVLHYVFLPPNRRYYQSFFDFARKQSLDDQPDCYAFRLQIKRWRGVRVDADDPDRATVMATGVYEFDHHADGTWEERSRMAWRAVVGHKDGRWRIRLLLESSPDQTDSG